MSKHLSFVASRIITGVSAATLALTLNASAEIVGLSPVSWPEQERMRLEALEAAAWTPPARMSVKGSGGVISATVSPVAVHAGIQVLKAGGTAADAAAATALTQITRQLGSVVSYAGIFTMVYFDAKTQQVYSLDAGYNTYKLETEPMTIPVGDLGALNFGRKPDEGGAKGRETLVPGFMAGLEAMHARFGKLPFGDLFEPALWYCEHGVRVSPVLNSFFDIRAKQLARTPEGQSFLRQAGGERPHTGDLFVQSELANTLSHVAREGADYLYKGSWAKAFVTTVRREGGKVTADDLASYRPTWSEPARLELWGNMVYTNGAPNYGCYALFGGLNLAEALHLDGKPVYWKDPDTFEKMARIVSLVTQAPAVNPHVQAFLRSRNVDTTPANQLEKPYAEALAPFLDSLEAPAADNGPHHSNSIVVVDREGNIAAITHTINAVIWGDTGIVVGGIPLPDSAAFQQQALAFVSPGGRLPHQIIDTVVLRDGKPVMATASIGSSLAAESLRVLLGVLGQHATLGELMKAPPLLATFDPATASLPLGRQPIPIPERAYASDFRSKLTQKGIQVAAIPNATVEAVRGTTAVVVLDPTAGTKEAQEDPQIMVHAEAE